MHSFKAIPGVTPVYTVLTFNLIPRLTHLCELLCIRNNLLSKRHGTQTCACVRAYVDTMLNQPCVTYT